MKRRLLLQWDSTNACNLKCSHCYHNVEGNACHKVHPEELTLGEVRRMLDDLTQTAQRWGMKPHFNISGGEPLLRSGLTEILATTQKMGISTKLLTNGTLVTSEVAHTLFRLGIRDLQISIDGTREKHNAIRGFEYAYDKAFDGVKNASNEGIAVGVSMTALKTNVEDFEDVVIQAGDFGAKFVGVQSYVPNPELGINDPNYLNSEETFELYKTIQLLARKYAKKIRVVQKEVLWQILAEDTPVKQESREEMKYLGGCSAGYFSIAVLADGTVLPCRRLPITIGHIRDGIKNLITEPEVMTDLRNLQKMKDTAECSMVTHCRGCRAVAHAVTGSYMEKDPMCFKKLVQIDY